jgi:purine-binding chemotaxis protein CheW
MLRRSPVRGIWFEMEPTALDPEKFLIFQLADARYGLEVSGLREMVGGVEITPVASNQPHYLGTFRHKGQVIPVLNLRRQFGLPESEMTLKNCFVIVNREGEAGSTALWVDSILSLVDVPRDGIEPVPELLSPVPLPYLKGQARLNGQIFHLLNLPQVLREAPVLSTEETPGAWFEPESEELKEKRDEVRRTG